MSETSAEDLLTIPDTETPTARAQQILDAIQTVQFTGNTPETDLIALINQSMNQNCGTVLPVLMGGALPAISGAVLMQEMHVENQLDTAALRGYILLSEQMQAGETPVRTEEYGTISVAVTSSRCRLLFSGTKEEPVFTVRIQIKGEISALAKGMLRLDATAFPILERAYAEEMIRCIEAYVHTVVHNGADAVGLLDVMQKTIPEIRRDEKESIEYLTKAAFDVQVVAEIDRVEEEDTPYL